jgi:hypothetical protein
MKRQIQTARRAGLLAGVAAGLVSAIAALAAFRGLPGGMGLFWLSPLPLFLAGLGFGHFTAEVRPWLWFLTRTSTCAILSAHLSRLSEEPVGWEWAYNKPADCLRICGVSETGVEGDDCLQYADEAGRILCNLTVCYLRYVSSTFIDQTGAWPALLLEAMGLRLAAALDRKTTQNRGNKIDTIDLADRKLKEAQRWDAVQRPWKPKPVGRFVRSRRQGVWGAY